MSGKSNKLVEQEDALGTFFESLMRDVETFAEQENDASSAVVTTVAEDKKPISPVATPVPQPRLVAAAKPVEVKTVSPSIFETLPAVAPPSVDTPPATATPAVEEVEDTEATHSAADAEPQTERAADPDWLGQELQAMLFKVAGLTLAVPLVDLNGVVEWDDEKVTAMPGHADFYLGLMSHLNKQIPVVDTARLVLPENKRRQMAGDDPYQRITRVVLINDGRFGLACDEVNEVVTLKADAVRWRSERTQRRWLAGTVIEHMCALVDATAFAEMLAARTPVDEFRE